MTTSGSGSGSGSTEQPASSLNKPLLSGNVQPAIRSAPKTARALTAEERTYYRSLTYNAYLHTPHWRVVRNRALRLAGFKCTKCQVGRELQVHHLSYDRLGEELDTDLEVLCRGCHLGLHVHEAKEAIGVYLKLVREALKAQTFETLEDLVEDVKCRCARARIPYHAGEVQAAVARAEISDRLAFPVAAPAKYAALLDAGRGSQPFTQAEACGILAQLNAQGLMRSMPTVKKFTRRQADGRIAVRQIAELILEQIAVCDALESEPDA